MGNEYRRKNAKITPCEESQIQVTQEVSVLREEGLYKVFGYVRDGDHPLEDGYVQIWEKLLHGEVPRIMESRTIPPDGYYEVSFDIDIDTDKQLSNTYYEFSIKILNAQKHLIYSFTDENRLDDKCPKCGADLVLRRGRFGKWLGCSMFPLDNYAMPYSK